MNAFDELTNNFSRLPGIGKKSAVRMVNWLLKQDSTYIQKFAQNLGHLQERIKPCSVCGTWTESDPCPICSNPLRDSSQICVVEQPQDVSTIEAYGEYKGKYHVLGGLIRPTVEGDTTALYLNKMIVELNLADSPKVTRLATGIPVGGDLEYIDKRTLALSFRGRSEF